MESGAGEMHCRWISVCRKAVPSLLQLSASSHIAR